MLRLKVNEYQQTLCYFYFGQAILTIYITMINDKIIHFRFPMDYSIYIRKCFIDDKSVIVKFAACCNEAGNRRKRLQKDKLIKYDAYK